MIATRLNANSVPRRQLIYFFNARVITHGNSNENSLGQEKLIIISRGNMGMPAAKIHYSICYPGGSICRMAEHFMTKENFTNGVRSYLKEHIYDNAESEGICNRLPYLIHPKSNKCINYSSVLH